MGYGALRRLRKIALATVLASPLTVSAVAAEPVVIAALGDSLTQGYGLAPDQGLVPVLQRWLDAKGVETKLINAGVSGDTTAGGLARVAWTLTPDVQGLIVSLGANDLLRGIAPEAARANLDGIMQAASTAGVAVLIVGFPAPGNFGPDYKQQFDAIYPDLAAQYATGLMPNLLAPLEAATQGDKVLADYLQADRLHPNPAGLALIVEGLGPHVLDLVERVK